MLFCAGCPERGSSARRGSPRPAAGVPAAGRCRRNRGNDRNQAVLALRRDRRRDETGAWSLDLLADDELQDAITILDRLDREVQFESATGAELDRTMRVACRDGLTFYDASYLSIAERDGLSLVTEDTALRNAAIRQSVSTETVSDL
jgi:predicted nucleic acid-binding protein